MNFGTSKNIVLDLYQNRYVSVNVAQYDIDSREVIVQITDDGKPYIVDSSDVTVRIKFMKSDGKPVLNDCEILDDGTVRIKYTDQMTVVSGRCNSELMLIEKSTQAVLHTMRFITNVQASSVPSGVIESTPEFLALENALAQVDNIVGGDYTEQAEAIIATLETYEQEALEVKDTIDTYTNGAKEAEQSAILAANNVAIAESEILEKKNIVEQYTNEASTARDAAVLAADEASATIQTLEEHITSAEETEIRITEVADTYEAAVDNILANEEARVQAEKLRVNAETLREENEEERMAAESSRVTNEQERTDAEAIRVSNENARIAAENTRVTAETERATAESTRNSNETLREENESIRIANENTRQTSESTRVDAENARATAEVERDNAEKDRVSAEALRVSAEAERKTNTDTALAEIDEAIEKSTAATTGAENATTSANEATEKANTATKEANTLIEEMEALIANENIVHTNELGVAGGVAMLDENGYIPSSQLPGFVDDVLDGTYNEANNQFLDLEGNAYTPESGKLYIDVNSRVSYRWSGTTYVSLTSSVELGTTSSTAYPGDRGLAVENRVTALEEYHNNIPASDIKFDNSDTDLLSANVQGAIKEVSEGLSQVHSHDNKAVLDGITSTLVSNWDDANSKKHEHSNKEVLDSISSTLVDTWNTVSNKVDKEDGKGLSTNDYTNEEKTQVATNKSDISSLKSDVEDLQNALVTTTSTTLNNSKAGGYKLLSMSGNSVQNGTPTPDAPQSIENVGDCVEMIQGFYSTSTGAWASGTTAVCSKNPIPCSSGDVIAINTESAYTIRLFFYNDTGFLSATTLGGTSVNGTAPSGATYFNIALSTTADITPSTVGKISLTINGKYVVSISVYSSNLLDINNFVLGSPALSVVDDWVVFNYDNTNSTSDMYLPFYTKPSQVLKENTKYAIVTEIETLSNNVTVFSVTNNATDYPSQFDTSITYTKTGVFVQVATSKSSFEGVTTLNRGLIRIPAGTSGSGKFRISIIEDTTVTADTFEYESHKEKAATVLLNAPLCDTDVMSNKEVARKRASVVFDGSDDENWVASVTSKGDYRLTIAIADMKPTGGQYTIGNILSSHYQAILPSESWLNDVNGITPSASANTLIVNDLSYNTSDVTLWKAHLQSNPLTVEYDLAEEVIETFDTDSQIALNSLETFDTVTYINVDSRIKPSEIKGEYGTTETSALAIKACNEACSAEIVANNNSGSGGSNYTFVEGNNVTITENGEEITISAKDTTYGVATSSTLGLVKSGTDITVDSSGNVSVNDDSHNHTIANVDGLQTALDGKAASSHGTHVTYSTTAPLVAGTASVGSAATVSRSDHVHPAQTTITGNAGSATKLETARTVRVDLGSEASASFDGTSAIAPGVTGILPVTHGGTGATTVKDAIKNLCNSQANTAPEYILGFNTSYEGAGYTSIANLKTTLGLGTAAYTNSTAYASSSHTHNYAGSSSAGGVATSAVTLSGLTATVTELNYCDGVTSNIQTQLNGKAATSHTHSNATTSTAGLMSASDKTKLDGIATGANAYTHPSSGVTAGTYRSVTVNAQGHVTAGSNPTLTVAQGGTGATTAAAARANLGIDALIEDLAIVAVDANNDGNVVLNAYTVSSLTSAEGVSF